MEQGSLELFASCENVGSTSTTEEPDRALLRSSSSSLNKPTPRKIVIGVCCTDVKCYSKPFQEILNRLRKYDDFTVVIFGEKFVNDHPPEEWPLCDCLISFFSAGFPLEKALRYTEINPTIYSLNNLRAQHMLLDRRMVYKMLWRNHIPTAKHMFVSRDNKYAEYPSPKSFIEELDYIEVDGVRMTKPFVEKPVDAEDHNVYIYYHSSQGGGSVRLFRKVGNKSSERYPDVSTVRREGSYVYEEFVPTDKSRDIKMYTVGRQYVHAEARKAPTVDGKVLRDRDGKEVRSVVTLSEDEKQIALKIILTFGQNVCGFDLLRGLNGQHYVCDVNGWSSVKGNTKYYDDCARILRDIFLRGKTLKGLPYIRPIPERRVLRGVVSVFRHADRTPKQKLKMKISNKDLLAFFGDTPREDVKIKNDSIADRLKLNKFVAIARQLLRGSESAEDGGASEAAGDGIDMADEEKWSTLMRVLDSGFGGTKLQLKALSYGTNERGEECVERALVVCKWGGVLTHAGMGQARHLGRHFARAIVPPEFVDGVQIFSNNERRVKRTAEQFWSGLTNKEEVPAGVVQDTKETAKLLGHIALAKEHMDRMKHQLHEMLHNENAATSADAPGIKNIGNPVKTMTEMYMLMDNLHAQLHPAATLCEGENVRMMKGRWDRLRQYFYNPKKSDRFDTTKIPDVFDYIAFDVVHNQNSLEDDLHPLFGHAESLASFIVPAEYGITPEDKLIIGSLICEPLFRRLVADVREMGLDPSAPKARFYFSSESHLHTLRNVLLHSGVTKFQPLIEPMELNYLTHIAFRIYENLDTSDDEDDEEEDDDQKDSGSGGGQSSPASASPSKKKNRNDDPESRFQIECLFSHGTSKNPYGVLNDEHRQRVSPLVSIHDHLTLADLDAISAVASSCKLKHLPVKAASLSRSGSDSGLGLSPTEATAK